MYFSLKLCSSWLKILAYACAIGSVIVFFTELSESELRAFLWLLYGAIAFLFWKALSIVTLAAEQYLGLIEDQEDTDEEF